MEREEASKSKDGEGREEEAGHANKDVQTSLEIHLVQGSESKPIQPSLDLINSLSLARWK